MRDYVIIKMCSEEQQNNNKYEEMLNMKNGSLREVIKGWRNNWEDHTTTPNGSLYREGGVLFSYGEHFPLAVHVGNYFLINADRYSNSTSKHQSYLLHECSGMYAVEIPFSALSAMISDKTYSLSGGYQFTAKDLPNSMTILDTEKDKWLPTNTYRKDGTQIMNHVLGGTLFKWNDRYIFSGIDETGIGNSRYFMTELVGEPQTVAEALEAMKPQEVKDYEAKGYEVRRQGEWFFVKCVDSIQPQNAEKDYHLKGHDGDTGHHFATEGIMIEEVQFVKGIVKHEERDHKQCKLYDDPKQKGWWMAFHNVQVKSFNAFGNVD